MRSRTMMMAAVATLALGACADAPADDGTDATTQNLLASAPPQGAPAQEIDIAELGFDRGDPDAPVRVIEMSDYGCGYCRQFHLETWPLLRDDFVESGKIEWKFLPFVTGMFRNSPSATLAAECVLEQSEELFEDMNFRIWDGQREWKGSAEPDPILRGWADETGADMDRYDSCLGENRRSERVAAATSIGRQAGVRGTPTFFVVGYPPLQGALPTETFHQVLSMVYQDATKEGGDR